MSIESGKVGMRSDGDYDYISFELCCDFCGERYRHDSTSFMDTVEIKKTLAKEDGWSCFWEDGEWYDLCPECTLEWRRRTQCRRITS